MDAIQWTKGAKYWDKPWNPLVGCRPISPACDHCYAKASTERFGCSFDPHETSKTNPPRRGVVFCGNMTDCFGDWVDELTMNENIVRTLGHSEKATYLWLTKRPERMCKALHDGRMFPMDDPDCDIPFSDCEFGNQYFGFTAENQEWYKRRIKDFRLWKPTWANGWLSAEPLLGPIDLGIGYIAPEDMPFKWIVVGCESGPQRRPCKIEWVEGIVAQAQARGIPVFVKQLNIEGICERDITKFPEHLQVRQIPWNKGVLK